MNVLVQRARSPFQQYLEFSAARSPSDGESLLIVPFRYQQYWQNDQAIELAAVYRFVGESVRYGVVELQDASLDVWAAPPAAVDFALREWLVDHDACLFEFNEPLPLLAVSIPKPWGQEIWYTGVEQRGVACFGDRERHVPIPYLLEVMPAILGQTAAPLVLLKILDPLPDEVFGDLYFELHREKQEVYIVTHVDPQAWPGGRGQMRIGFDPEKIKQAGSDKAFRQQFLQHVLAYRAVRSQIDHLLDEQRTQQGYVRDAEIPLEQRQRWLAEIPAELATEEKALRRQMESYFGTLPLQRGDVVKIPVNVPHALQHGMRTIEFQTPVYERLIIAFAQQVLTQAHWDTEQAAAEMEIVAPSLPELDVLSSEGARIEQVAAFGDFEVRRVTLSAAQTHLLVSDVYQLLIVVAGALIAGKQHVGPEQAIVLPAGPTETIVRTQDAQQVTFLVATPSS